MPEDEKLEDVIEEPEKKYSDQDVDEIVSKKYAKWQEKHEKEISEAKKLADMNAQQKTEYEKEKLKARLDELERANTVNEMGKVARAMLSESNINVDDDLIRVLLSDDAETTKKNVDSFRGLFDKAVENAVSEKLKSKTPPRMGGTGGMTKEEIFKIKDSETRRKAIAENIELFN